MAKLLSKIATECARRWIAANDRRVKRGKTRIPVTLEAMRDFSAGIADDTDALQLDVIADLATQKVLEYERRTSATKGD